MAQLALTLGGAIAGSYFGPLGSFIGSTVGAIAGSYIDSLWMGSPGAQPPRTIDLKVTSTSYGQPISIPYGTIRVAGEMIAASNLIATKHDVEVGGGLGLGTEGSGGAVFSYSANFAVMLGEPPLGQIIKVLRLWGDGKLIYDVRPQARNVRRRGAAMRFYPGAATQLPDPWLQAHFGAAITPAYRGRAVVVLQHLQLADFANHIPNITAEVATGTTDAHPFSFVDPGGGSNFSHDLALDDDSGVLMKVGFLGDIAKIDTRLVTTLLGPSDVCSNGIVGNPVFGSDGFLYVPQDAEGIGGTNNFDRWSKIDPASLAIVDQVGALSLTFDSANHNLLAYNALLKSRPGSPYLLGIANGGAFIGFELQIVSIGQLEAAAAMGPLLANRLRFVAKTRSSYGDLVFEDGEVDVSSITNAGSPTSPIIQSDIWAVNGDNLYRLQLTDNLVAGGGTVGGGANGSNPLVVAETIDLSAAWSVSDPASLTFLSDEHALIINRGSKIVKYNLDSRTVTGAELDIGAASGSEMIQGPIDGLMFFGQSGGHTLKEVDVIGWVINRTIELHDFDASLSLASQKYDSRDGAIWVRTGTALYKLFLDRAVGGSVTLASIVSDICLRAGLAAGDIDVTDLAGVDVRGYVIPRQMAARDAIAPLAQAFMFKAVESDFKLKFVRLGAAVARALNLSDVGAYPETANRPDPLLITDANQRTLPRRVNCRYINAGNDYEIGTQSAQRHQAIVGSSSDISLDLPIVLTDNEAKSICEKILAKVWTNARKYETSVSRAQARLDPVDVITVDDGVELHRMGIDQMDVGADGTIKISALREDDEVYLDGFPLGGGAGGGGPANPVLGHTDIELMDLVLLRDGDDHKGWYLAAAPDTGDPDAWLGWNLLRSIDGGESYTLFLTGSTAALIGRATEALAAPRAWTTWDRVNTVTVRTLPGAPAPSSSTEAAVLNGANLAVLGDEIINFVTVVDNGDGTYTLSTLLRGQRGSDKYIDTHALGDRFVLIEFPAKVSDVTDPDLGLPRDYKTQSIGDSSIPASFRVFTEVGNRLRPLTAADPQLTDGGGGDLALAWQRRSRVGGENDWADGSVAVPLGEASEAYQVDIYDGADVVRTVASSTPAITYTSAQQTTDFGGGQTSLKIAIYQMSETVGRGFAFEATLVEGA